LVVTEPTMLPRGIDWGGTGSAGAEASPAEALPAATTAGPTGAHGGGGQAVVGGGGATLGVAEATTDEVEGPEDATVGVFSGDWTGGSPSQASNDKSGPAETTVSRVTKRFITFSIQ
jgi:hypothetical protein